MLVTTIDSGIELQELFQDCGRQDHFSLEGFDALYNFLYTYSEIAEKDFKVDVIALCCDFTEYESWEELYNNYSYSYNKEAETWKDVDQDDFKEWVSDRTTVIEVTDYKNNKVGIIIQNF